MSGTDTPQGSAASGDETQAHSKVADGAPRAADAEDPSEQRSPMRQGALARTAPGRDLAARRARAQRGAGAPAAGAVGAPEQPAAADSKTEPTTRERAWSEPKTQQGTKSADGIRAGAPGSTARTENRSPSRPAPRRGGPRRVRLTAQRVDPWSVLKISFLVSVALGIASVVMVAVLWTVLSGMNVFSTVNDFVTQVTSGENNESPIDIMDYLGFGRIVSLSASLGVLNVFLLTALATLTAFLYNICAALVGGAQVTLSDE